MNAQSTYWVESECDGLFVFCKSATGEVGKCSISPLDDPEWGFDKAYPVKYILECAEEAELNCFPYES